MKFLPFDEAKQFVHKLGLKTQLEWGKYCKSGKKPIVIPTHPERIYRSEWKGIGDWLGTGRIANQNRSYKTFDDALPFVHGLNLKSQLEWRQYLKSGNKLDDIPTHPDRVYKNHWEGWGPWLGTGRIANQELKYQTFVQARAFVHNLRLKSRNEWAEYCKSGKKPSDIPYQARQTYKEKWKGWGDWLGTGFIATHRRNYLPFEEAKKYVHKLGLKSGKEWQNYLKKGKKPSNIPANPSGTYENEWKGMGDWLGTGIIANQKRQYLPFEEAKKFVHGLGLKTQEEWSKYLKSGNNPIDIPTHPDRVYIDKWKTFGDWLGTGTVANQKKEFLPFEEARRVVHSLGLKSQDEWIQYYKSVRRPLNIPASPSHIYPKEWNGIADWLGYEESTWSVRKVKELLSDLIGSKVIYEWDEAVLYSFLLRKGVLSLYNDNRHSNFFKNLIEASKTERGKKTIEEYAYSDSETPPDISVNVKTDSSDSEEIETASLSDLSSVVENTDALDYGDIKSVEQILEHTNVLESINVDEEAMQFYLDYSVDELWRRAFKNEAETVRKVKQAGKNGNKYHDTVIDTFLEDYEGSTKLEISSGYTFPYEPTLMQRYVAYKVTSLPYFGNFSGTGAGKTLSAILASRTIDSKLTIIVCPNDVVEQWKRNILDTFPNSKIITGKDAFDLHYSQKEYQYAVLNYDKFSQEESPNLILNLARQKIVFVLFRQFINSFS